MGMPPSAKPASASAIAAAMNGSIAPPLRPSRLTPRPAPSRLPRSPCRRPPRDLFVGHDAAGVRGGLTPAEGGEEGHLLADLLEGGRLRHSSEGFQGDLLLGQRGGFGGHWFLAQGRKRRCPAN